MYVLFNIQNFNNITVQNDRLLNVDPDHNHDFTLPNCINVDRQPIDEPIICNVLQLLVT